MTRVTDWKEKAKLLRLGMANEQPPLKMEKVMELLGYNSKASAEYALEKLEEMGEVVWIASGKGAGYGNWFLK